MAKKKQVALVTYEDQVKLLHSALQIPTNMYGPQSPPQLWEIENPEMHADTRTCLILRQTYMPHSQTSLSVAGACQFGGKDEKLVISVGKGMFSICIILLHCGDGTCQPTRSIFGNVPLPSSSTKEQFKTGAERRHALLGTRVMSL